MTEPMSDEQLELYRAMLSGNKYEHGVPLSSARVLLAEVERLRALVGLHEQALGWAKDVRDFEVNYVSGERESYKQLWENAHAENAAMREIVRQVAEADVNSWNACDICGVVPPHRPDCPVARARALVAQWDTPAE